VNTQARSAPPKRPRGPRKGRSVYFPSLELTEAVLGLLREHGTADMIEPVERAVARNRSKSG
jgi:hypothetical protein